MRDDPRLDRVPRFDDKSRQYPIRTVAPARPRSYTWSLDAVLDQGREGACTGFATVHEALARPCRVPGLSTADALAVYGRAKELDDFPPGTEGSSVLAAVTAGCERGWYAEFRWAFGLDDLLVGLGKGPAILGVNWYDSAYTPVEEGGDPYVRLAGPIAGGHAILARGLDVRRERVLLHNSWGKGWGRKGTAWISYADLDRLLREDGEACIPVVRKGGK